jgi:hypothetical protein
VGRHDEAAERVSDKHVSLERRSVLHNHGKLGDDPIERSWARRRVAPRQAGAIVRVLRKNLCRDGFQLVVMMQAAETRAADNTMRGR